ncbi:Ldh family oxidoreductase [Gracilibacillus dipsosauri]|uniref:Ldh family oxidoreductase n=1 Tax=Gracilibacillus dipsosauri TaxID=178340 RepID=UPI0024090B5E
MKETIISCESLLHFTEDVLAKCLPKREAHLIAETLVDADMRGIFSHGVQRLSGYLKRMEEGLMERETNVVTVSDSYTTAVLDAHNGWGQVASIKAMEIAIQKAKEYGTGFVGVRNSNHNGTATYYTALAAEQGHIGIAMTNASPIMVPFGAKEPSLGPNPISIAIPTGEGKMPIILDMSTSNVARGKIMVAKKNNTPIPEGWAITKEGYPTTDPQEAWEGYVLPLGPKGSGLAIIVDILSGILTGSLFGKQIPRQYDDPYPQQVGHLFGAIQVGNFIDPKDFYEKVERKVQETITSEPMEGFDRVYMPGEREQIQKKRSMKEGIPISNNVFEELRATGENYGIDLNEYVSVSN